MVDFLTQKMKYLDFRLLKFWRGQNLVDRFLEPFLKPSRFFGGKAANSREILAEKFTLESREAPA